MATCSMCNGTGEVVVTQEDEENETAKDYKVTCSQCGGSGVT
ncbi:hypothetical protein [Catenulispora pinistramenti]|nr:hypothetical protein [Catenulispora pinistramenti]